MRRSFRVRLRCKWWLHDSNGRPIYEDEDFSDLGHRSGLRATAGPRETRFSVMTRCWTSVLELSLARRRGGGRAAPAAPRAGRNRRGSYRGRPRGRTPWLPPRGVPTQVDPGV